MSPTHDGPILFRNTVRIADGHLEDFKQAVRRAVAFVDEHGPQLIVDVFIDEQRMLAYSFQLYRDWDSTDEPSRSETVKSPGLRYLASGASRGNAAATP